MALARKTGTALWLQIEQALAQDILTGAIAVGTKLPPNRTSWCGSE